MRHSTGLRWILGIGIGVLGLPASKALAICENPNFSKQKDPKSPARLERGIFNTATGLSKEVSFFHALVELEMFANENFVVVNLPVPQKAIRLLLILPREEVSALKVFSNLENLTFEPSAFMKLNAVIAIPALSQEADGNEVEPVRSVLAAAQKDLPFESSESGAKRPRRIILFNRPFVYAFFDETLKLPFQAGVISGK
jgi:hypothetical protein